MKGCPATVSEPDRASRLFDAAVANVTVPEQLPEVPEATEIHGLFDVAVRRTPAAPGHRSSSCHRLPVATRSAVTLHRARSSSVTDTVNGYRHGGPAERRVTSPA